MSGTVNFTLTGFQGLEDRLKLLADDVATKVGQAANRAGAAVVLKYTKSTAPVSAVPEGKSITRKTKGGSTRQETHHKIKNNIKVTKVRTTGQNAVSNSVVVSNKAYQAEFVQFGSIHNTPDPWMTRALESNRDEVIAKIAEQINKRLTKMGV